MEDGVYPDPRMRAIDISFSDKCINEKYHHSLVFNDTKLQFATIQKQLGLILDSKRDLIYWH